MWLLNNVSRVNNLLSQIKKGCQMVGQTYLSIYVFFPLSHFSELEVKFNSTPASQLEPDTHYTTIPRQSPIQVLTQ